jgi:hypothetical protein
MYEYACSFVIKYIKFWFIGILYKKIQHAQGFGSTKGIHLLKRIQTKFTLYFAKSSMIYYEF